MKQTFIVNESCVSMRLDRWIRNNIGKFPQSLIEKSIRNGNIKLNSKKVKSSTKLNENKGETTSPKTTNPPAINKTISINSKSKDLISFH